MKMIQNRFLIGTIAILLSCVGWYFVATPFRIPGNDSIQLRAEIQRSNGGSELPNVETMEAAHVELPFLGKIPCKSATVQIRPDGLSASEQNWSVLVTDDGRFIGADYVQPGFSASYDLGYVQDVYESSGEKITGLPKTKQRVDLLALRKKAAKMGTFSNKGLEIKKIKIRRVMLDTDRRFKNQEVYIISIWGKEIMQGSFGASWDVMRMVLDSDGNELWTDNGL